MVIYIMELEFVKGSILMDLGTGKVLPIYLKINYCRGWRELCQEQNENVYTSSEFTSS
jgi:hypothetical protein